ncbi:MAG: 3-deoxy-D-manno-octulosonic acid transferase, partial [bacterium]
SDESARKYKYLGPYLRDITKRIDCFSMQSEQDLSYITELGASKDKVFNTGNTKLDQAYISVKEDEKEQFYQKYGLNKEEPIFVVGSTHANEEEELINVYKKLNEQFRIQMILAPRHISRAEEIEEIFKDRGIKVVGSTRVQNYKRESLQSAVILLDTIGELAKIYSIADFVFVGGSLAEIGGHNILEPAAHGKLVFFGPHMFNFKDSTQMLLENDAAIQVKDSDELILKLLYFLKRPDLSAEYGQRAKKLVESNQGASRRNVELINRLIKEKEVEKC